MGGSAPGSTRAKGVSSGLGSSRHSPAPAGCRSAAAADTGEEDLTSQARVAELPDVECDAVPVHAMEHETPVSDRPPDADRPPGSTYLSTWESDTREGRVHTVLLIAESVVLLPLIGSAFLELVPKATGGANAGGTALTLLQLVAWGGALGGFLHMVTSFVSALDTGPLHRGRYFRLAFRPVVGAGLAVVVYFVMQTGLLSPVSSATLPDPTASPPVGGNATDVYRALAIACLTGLFARRAMDKLREVFFTLFQTPKRGNAGS